MLESTLPYPRYRIETSGWDESNQFFIEECTLEWGDGLEKRVILRQQVKEGAVLFVRLIPPTVGGESQPVVYRAKNIGPVKADGRREIQLVEMRPTRARATEESLVTTCGIES